MSNRADRRQRHGRPKTPVLIAGEGIVAASLGHRYEATGHAELRPKIPGKHRWVASASWVLSDLAVETAFDPESIKIMDNENLMGLAIGCWDCEQTLGAQIAVDSVCPAAGEP